jgi:FKBP-type peptidyl-prolyl cis-trans isomerase FkpA
MKELLMSIRSLLLLSLAVAALGIGCGRQESPPAEGAAPPTTQTPAAAGPASTSAANPGAPDGSPFSVTHQVEGTGASPTATDNVKVHYAGRLADGTEFDSSIRHGVPVTFPLNGVISCWTQGVAQMKVGGKATLVCPPEMAYGANGSGPIPPNATLTFEVELLGIEPPR